MRVSLITKFLRILLYIDVIYTHGPKVLEIIVWGGGRGTNINMKRPCGLC